MPHLKCPCPGACPLHLPSASQGPRSSGGWLHWTAGGSPCQRCCCQPLPGGGGRHLLPGSRAAACCHRNLGLTPHGSRGRWSSAGRCRLPAAAPMSQGTGLRTAAQPCRGMHRRGQPGLQLGRDTGTAPSLCRVESRPGRSPDTPHLSVSLFRTLSKASSMSLDARVLQNTLARLFKSAVAGGLTPPLSPWPWQTPPGARGPTWSPAAGQWSLTPAQSVRMNAPTQNPPEAVALQRCKTAPLQKFPWGMVNWGCEGC